MGKLEFVFGMLGLILLTLAMFGLIVHLWSIQKEKRLLFLPRFIGATVHFAVPGWLILVVLNAYAKQWIVEMGELPSGNVSHLLLGLWALVVALFAYHLAFEYAIGFLDVKDYSFSILIADVTALTTHLMNFMAVAGYFFAVYGKKCNWLSSGFAEENEIFLFLAATVFVDLVVLSLYRFFVLPLGIEEGARKTWISIKERLLDKKRSCSCPHRRGMCHPVAQIEVEVEIESSVEEDSASEDDG